MAENTKEIKTCLIFPPQWIPMNPHLSICSLAGHLRNKGIPVKLMDLNIEFYRLILTPEYLRLSLEKSFNAYNYLEARVSLGMTRKETNKAFAVEAAWFLEIEKLLKDQAEIWKEVIDYIPEAVSVFDNKEKYYDPYQLVKAFITIDKALELISLPYFPSSLKFYDYSTPLCPFTIESILDYTQSRPKNMFIPFLTKNLIKILKEKADLYAISINSYSQVIPGLTLARMIKQRVGKDAHITLGGNYFARVKEAFLHRPEFFENFADTLVVHEGEEPFYELIRHLRGEIPITEVPRLIYYDKEEKKSKYTYDKKPPKMDDIGCQDLAGLPLEKYFTPEIVLTTRSSKGCYWQKCTFCDCDYGVEPDVKQVDTFIRDLKYLRDNYGIKDFEFIDECIFPDYGHQLSQRMMDENLNVHWFCNGRTEEDNTLELMQKYYKAGLRMVLWGVESGSERIMGLINKGVPFEGRKEVLRNSALAGVWNFAFVFFGFPSETHADAQATIDLISKNRDIIHSYGKSIFTLGKHSKIALKAKQLGLIKEMDGSQEFNSDYEFSYDDTIGMSREEVMKMSEKCRNDCYVAFDEPLWMYLRHREIIYQYVKQYGVEWVSNFKFTDDQMLDMKYLYIKKSEDYKGKALSMLEQDSP